MTAPENPPAVSRFTPEQIERNREFLKDLRANPKKAIGRMRDGIGRCCMCVAYDTAQRLGANLRPVPDHAAMPPGQTAYFYGWIWNHQCLIYKGNQFSAAEFNDGICGAPELTHAQIADAFEETWPELKADALLAARKEASHE